MVFRNSRTRSTCSSDFVDNISPPFDLLSERCSYQVLADCLSIACVCVYKQNALEVYDLSPASYQRQSSNDYWRNRQDHLKKRKPLDQSKNFFDHHYLLLQYFLNFKEILFFQLLFSRSLLKSSNWTLENFREFRSGSGEFSTFEVSTFEVSTRKFSRNSLEKHPAS